MSESKFEKLVVRLLESLLALKSDLIVPLDETLRSWIMLLEADMSTTSVLVDLGCLKMRYCSLIYVY